MVTISAIMKQDSEYNSLLKDARARRIDLVELYKGITGNSSAPKDIVEMDELVNNGVGEKSPVDAELQNVETPDPATDEFTYDNSDTSYKTSIGINEIKRSGNAVHSDSSFVANICNLHNSHYDKSRCLTNKTNNYYLAQYMDSFMSNLCVYRGKASHKLRRKLSGEYRGLIDNTVKAGYCSEYTGWATSRQDYLKLEVYNADGDGWHFQLGVNR